MNKNIKGINNKKLIRTIMIKDIENQIETVNRNKDTKIKGISITIIIMILIITIIEILFA